MTEHFGSFDRGLEVRRAVLGHEYVEAALGPGPPSPLQQLLTETAWGGVWARDQLPRRTRSLLTVALLTALNRPTELRSHVRGALRNGCTPEEIREVVLHCAIYAGVPAAVDGSRGVEEVLDQEEMLGQQEEWGEHDGRDGPAS